MEWYLAVLKKYTVFEGRARRKEFWYFALVNFLIFIPLTFIGLIIAVASARSDQFGYFALMFIPLFLYSLFIIIPSIAVTVRRLHDTNRSGWWYLINFVPWVGGIILFVFTVLDGTPGPNQYGPDPKAGERLSSAPPPVTPQSSGQT
jgi:uncharacterized membrane protein YhaH (DUF805 family)